MITETGRKESFVADLRKFGKGCYSSSEICDRYIIRPQNPVDSFERLATKF